MVSVMRLLGIPCRVVTNFQSAHDTNKNLTIDTYFDSKGVKKKESSDSIWSLELFPFNVKSLLRRAAAYEALERYRHAYIDYKTALQIDCNIAAAHDGTNRDAVRDCTEALRIDGSNVKALYRRAQAHKELKDIKPCVDDLSSLLKVEPKNTAALKLLQEVQKKK
ncbi:hypothetical protein GOODEAATRI_009160 [Goodea atripinnis]|uniref:Mitochondrial import receptor subunit TOM34 n=1 Tax=Goodea atripinnis TaxID=208336 RepID=A0ABV0MQJ8_9TELE